MIFAPPSSTLLTLDRTAELAAQNTLPIPAVTDLVGYDALVNFNRKEGLDRMPGDFLEIGCFLGGGTAKLAQLARVTGKLVWVIDVFDPSFDHTANTNGDRMADLYRGHLQSSSQEEIFRAVTRPWADCIRVIKEDSRKASLPEGTRLAFAFGDGNHDPIWVKNDFQLIWDHLLPGGWAGFHDYGGDLPEVTAALDSMMRDHTCEIERVETMKERWVLLVKKRCDLTNLTTKDSQQ
jgi:SAM-dependent methyltransferase